MKKGLSAEERLIPIWIKVNRAKKHLAELKAMAESYRDSSYPVAIENPKPKFPDSDVWRLPVVSFDMLVIAGDVLHNLRSALDHTIYQLALVRNPRTSPRKLEYISFPIGKDLQAYKSIAGSKVQSVIEPRAMEFINELKPYKGGDADNALWRLHELNNIDKHRRLITVGTHVLCECDGIFGYYLLKDTKSPFSSTHLPKGQQEAKISGLKSLAQFQRAQRRALLPTLEDLTVFVERTIESFRFLLERAKA